jgi:hypothetical protein
MNSRALSKRAPDSSSQTASGANTVTVCW